MTATSTSDVVGQRQAPRRSPGLVPAVAALVLGAGAILGALGSQYLGGLEPCELCLEQRLPYYWGLPVLALILLLWRRVPRVVAVVALAVVAALFVWGSYLGVYHAGVEWGFWPGPTSCSGIGGSISFEQLGDIDAARVIPCDVVQFRFLGISLAGFNALISAAMVVLLGIALLRRWRQEGIG